MRAGGIMANQATREKGKIYRNSDSEVQEQYSRYITFICIGVIISRRIWVMLLSTGHNGTGFCYRLYQHW